MDDSTLNRFVAAARQNGAGDQAILSILRNAGWPEKEAVAALASYYEQLIGAPVPQRRRSPGGPREAFLHLLSFVTLAVWCLAAGSLWFTLIDLWLPDPASARAYPDPQFWMARNLASILVAFPVFLLVMRTVWRELLQQPSQADSPLRRWLTYLALLIAAGTIIGDLVAFVEYLLRGEVTARFLSKVAVVLVLAGGVFWFYLKSVQPAADEQRVPRLRRAGRIGLAAALAVVILTLVPAFLRYGTPAAQRLSSMDDRRSSDLESIADLIHNRWVSTPATPAGTSGKLSASLEDLPERAALRRLDPVTGAPYEYHRLDESRYELCAVFSTDTTRLPVETRRSLFRAHPAGRYCFAVDAMTAGRAGRY